MLVNLAMGALGSASTVCFDFAAPLLSHLGQPFSIATVHLSIKHEGLTENCLAGKSDQGMPWLVSLCFICNI